MHARQIILLLLPTGSEEREVLGVGSIPVTSTSLLSIYENVS